MADLYDVHNARFTDPPTAEEMDAALRKSFGMTDTPQTDHDPTNPEHVTRELMKPFPPSALYNRDGRTYVQYQQVVRRLIYATGNRFSTEVHAVTEKPWGMSKRGVEQVLLEATVSLTIPVLDSTRTHTGVQVASVGFGEDMRKGAVSDALKKAAQEFGVAIDLAGADGEDTAPELPHAPQHAPRAQQAQSPQNAPRTAQGGAQRVTDGDYMAGQGTTETQRGAGNRQFAPARPGTGGPATDGQKRALWKISGASKEQIDQWAAEYGESNANLTKGTASVLIDTYGGNR